MSYSRRTFAARDHPARTSTATRWRAIYYSAQTAVVILAAVCLHYYYDFTAEDAFITYRYSETLVDSGALVYNPGEAINALTSPLHAIISAALYAATGQTVMSNKVMAILFLTGVTLLIWYRFKAQPHWQLLALSLLVLPPSVLLWTLGGLETPILLLLATLMAWMSDRARAQGMNLRLLCVLGLLASFAFLTRYDSILFSLPILAYAAFRSRSAWNVVMAGAVAAILPLTWFAFSLWFYGDLLPTSFYVKTPDGSLENLAYNAVYIATYLQYVGLIPAMALAIAQLWLRRRVVQTVSLQLKRQWWLYLGLALEITYGLMIATHHMMFSSRYFVPFLPTAVLLVVDFVRASEPPAATRASHKATALFLVFVGGLVGLQLYQEAYTYDRSVNGLAPIGEYRALGVREYVDFTRILRQEGLDIEAHWMTVEDSLRRPPRILTYAAGVLPYTFREAYIYEKLVSYRHCQQRVRQGLYADYLHLIAPRHGSITEQLPGPVNDFVLISAYEADFDGTWQRFLVYFNPNPRPHNLSADIGLPCRGREPLMTIGLI